MNKIVFTIDGENTTVRLSSEEGAYYDINLNEPETTSEEGELASIKIEIEASFRNPNKSRVTLLLPEKVNLTHEEVLMAIMPRLLYGLALFCHGFSYIRDNKSGLFESVHKTVKFNSSKCELESKLTTTFGHYEMKGGLNEVNWSLGVVKAVSRTVEIEFKKIV